MNTLFTAWTIARKDLRIYFRDRTGMALGFLLPIALIAVFGFVMKFAFGGGSGMPRATLWVADEDQSDQSRRLIELLRENETLRLRPKPGDPPVDASHVRRLVEQGEAHHALILEAGYGEAVEAGKLPGMTVVRDPGRTLEDRLIQFALVQTFMAATEGQLWPAALGNMMRQSGMQQSEVDRLITSARVLNRLLSQFVTDAQGQAAPEKGVGRENQRGDGDSHNGGKRVTGQGDRVPFDAADFVENMVPIRHVDIQPPTRPRNLTYALSQSVAGTTVMMLMFGLIACSTMLLSEREGGTLPRLLTSAAPHDAVFWGKFLFCFVIGMIQLTVLFTFGNVLFQVGAFRDPITLLALSITWAVAATSFGMLVACWAQTAKQAEGLATLLILIMAALGGCWFPIQLMNLPRAAEIATQSMVTYWAMKGYQGMFWEQWSWTHPQMLLAMGVQWAFACVASPCALLFYRRRYVAG